MNNLSTISQESFYILNGMPSFVGLEQKKCIETEAFSRLVDDLLSIGLSNNLNRVSVHLKKDSIEFFNHAAHLEERGFKLFTTSVEYYKSFSADFELKNDFSYFTLEDSRFTETEFKSLWGRVMQGSGNANSTLSMDEQLVSVKHELGSGWMRNCGVFYKDKVPVAVCIPHIEPGTEDEGRLFYFGLLPEERGKGYAGILHKLSLKLLKELGASYYVGSTHETNTAMQRIFQKSGCEERGRRASYYYYFDK